MSDLAPRPRGGWQVGSSLARTAKVIASASTDSADGYTVDRSQAPTFVVRHWPSQEATRPCCRPVKVTQRDGESEIDALARAEQLCQQQHAAAAATVPRATNSELRRRSSQSSGSSQHA